MVARQHDDNIIVSDIDKNLQGPKCICVPSLVAQLLMVQEEFADKQANRQTFPYHSHIYYIYEQLNNHQQCELSLVKPLN